MQLLKKFMHLFFILPVTYEVINQIQIFFIVEFIESQECQFDNLLNQNFLSNWIAQQQIDIQKEFGYMC